MRTPPKTIKIQWRLAGSTGWRDLEGFHPITFQDVAEAETYVIECGRAENEYRIVKDHE